MPKVNNPHRYTRRRRTAVEYGKSVVLLSWYHNYIETFLNGMLWAAPAEYIPVKHEDVCKPNDTLNMQILKGTAALKITWQKRMGLCE